MRPQPKLLVPTLLVAFGVAVAAPAVAALLFGGHYLNLRGLRVYYEEHGEGPALILLHGGTGNGSQFAKQVPAFETRYHVIVPDARAQGRTGDLPGPLTYAQEGEDVVALMDALHLRTASIVGWSDGGVAGLEVAAHHPERVTHLVAIGANTRSDGVEPWALAWLKTATPDSLGPETEKAYRARAPDPGHYREAMAKLLAMWAKDSDLTPELLSHIRAKTLIVAGEHDLVRRDHTEEFAKSIPGATVWIVPGAEHDVMIAHADLVNPKVIEFLGR